VQRLKQHLIQIGTWSEAQHEALLATVEEQVATAWKQAMAFGTLNEGEKLDPKLMFSDVYKEMPAHLQLQCAQMESGI
jgi:2-oxoisovalerate dehydrogenase E1 component alpha subunit